jgi:hypothetical protein
MNDEILRKSVEGPLRMQSLVLKGTAVTSVLCGVGLLVGAVLTALSPAEEIKTKVGLFVLGLLMLGGGAWMWIYFTKHFQTTRSLIFERPQDIAKMHMLQVNRGSMVVNWSVQITDKAGKRVGVVVPSEEAGAEMIRRIEALRA